MRPRKSGFPERRFFALCAWVAFPWFNWVNVLSPWKRRNLLSSLKGDPVIRGLAGLPKRSQGRSRNENPVKVSIFSPLGVLAA